MILRLFYMDYCCQCWRSCSCLQIWPDLLWCVYRQNALQVIAVDGVCSGIIQCLSAEDCIDWLQAIAMNISNLTKHNVSVALSRASDFLITSYLSCQKDLVKLRRLEYLHSLIADLSRHFPVVETYLASCSLPWRRLPGLPSPAGYSAQSGGTGA